MALCAGVTTTVRVRVPILLKILFVLDVFRGTVMCGTGEHGEPSWKSEHGQLCWKTAQLEEFDTHNVDR